MRQSTLAQVERNKESTARQYDLVARARQLGWPASAIRVIDGDLGVSGSALGHRDAFDGLVAEVALGQVGIILALEVSRLVRDNAAWYRLLDLAGACDTLVADADGIYHPGLFNDRLILGLKGIMSEHLCGYRHKASLGYSVNRRAPPRRPMFALVTDRKSPFARTDTGGPLTCVAPVK